MKQQIIERLLKAINSRQWNMSAAFGGASGVAGSPGVLPGDVNKAIEAWFKHNDPSGVRQIATSLHLTGTLTDTEYEQIMKAIDGEA